MASELNWITTNSPDNIIRTDDIWFFDENVGWLVNAAGEARMTINGGASWDHRSSNLQTEHGGYLRCMGWSSRDTGWIGLVTGGGAGFEESLLYRTRNGGHNWEKVSLPVGAPGGICGLFAVSSEVVYAAGSNDPDLPGPSVVKTTDGGATWTVIPMTAHADNLIDVYFEDENTGWVVGGKKALACPPTKPGYFGRQQYAQLKPVILKTQDGGQSWVNMAANTEGFVCGEWGWKIQFLPGHQIGFVSLEDLTGAAMLRTEDAGQTWTRLAIKDAGGTVINNNLEGIGFIDSNNGWVGGWGQFFQGKFNSFTSDGGRTWSRQDQNDDVPASDPRVNVNRYRFIGNPPRVIYCSGKKVYRLSLDQEDAMQGRLMAEVHVASEPEGSSFQPSTLPSDGGVSIHFSVPEGSRRLKVGIWNNFAVHQCDLYEEVEPAPGEREIYWDGSLDCGDSVPRGCFMGRITIDSKVETFEFSFE
ncbi:WD40/YVTN/BNR-like repeat-containing protein [Haloferula sp.]|uniref:WD40/YVTN/BNR-like repeat-containing protein n=1 Tax=Haloferula sp. TaxID=2497595 RepID=UPI00329F4BE2